VEEAALPISSSRQNQSAVEEVKQPILNRGRSDPDVNSGLV